MFHATVKRDADFQLCETAAFFSFCTRIMNYVLFQLAFTAPTHLKLCCCVASCTIANTFGEPSVTHMKCS